MAASSGFPWLPTVSPGWTTTTVRYGVELSLKKISDEVIHICVAGVCRDSFAGQEKNPLAPLPMEDIYQHRLLVNLSDVSMLNSSGVGWLLVCHKRCREAGGRWILHSVTPTAMKVLKLMRLHEVLDIAEDEQRALTLAKGKELSQ